MRPLITTVLVFSAVSLGAAAVQAKEPAAGHHYRLQHRHAMQSPGYFDPYASPPYINVWGSHVYLDRGGY